MEAHDTAAINKRNSEWEAAPKIFQFKDVGANCVAVGSSPRFKVYDVVFGFRRPEGVRSGSNNRFDGMVYLYQGKGGGRSIRSGPHDHREACILLYCIYITLFGFRSMGMDVNSHAKIDKRRMLVTVH
ncbi:hypothetical protein SAY86_022788 [Trapa natans]|uniref:Uncharacterized protein n=1 Tax=Trapa natans TaxID=22666 RepID=A0AAN7M671_TRANT|nr:hypothetical protein SAY86_022788 [Trapa natans]